MALYFIKSAGFISDPLTHPYLVCPTLDWIFSLLLLSLSCLVLICSRSFLSLWLFILERSFSRYFREFMGWLTLLQLLQTLLWIPSNHPWVGRPLPVSLAILILAGPAFLWVPLTVLQFSYLLFLGLENCFLPHRCWYLWVL